MAEPETDAAALMSIRHLLGRTFVSVDDLSDIFEQDVTFSALCREYRDIETNIHQLRLRYNEIEEELLAKIAVFKRLGNGTMTNGKALNADLRSAQDDLRRMLVDLIKAGLVSTDEKAVSRWRAEAVNLHEELRTRLATLTDEDVHLDAIWNQARQEALSDPLVQTEESMNPILPPKCLFTLSELMASDFNFIAAAARIRISTATG
jgi:hypothetical protein